jgi:tripartite-type tricarboxylate transporter receptor subunit TctC
VTAWICGGRLRRFATLEEVAAPSITLETSMFNINTSWPLVATAMGLSLTLFAGTGAAQTFPDKPIRLVVPYPAGGPLDIAARAVAEASRAGLGTVIVDNRSGAGGNIGADSVAKAPADGYTVLLGAVATHAINPSLYPKMPYDAQKDFAPLTLIANVPNVLVLNNEFASKNKINTVSDLIDYLKKNPGKTQYGSGGNGSAGHLAGEFFKMSTETFSLHIPYRGAGPAQLALLSGEVQFMFDNLASAAPRIREGKIKALGVTTLKPAALMPEIPALTNSGVPALKNFDISTWFGLFAPAGTPKPVLDKLVEQFNAALKSKSVVDTLARLAAEPSPTSPEELAALVRRDTAKYSGIIKFSGAKVD